MPQEDAKGRQIAAVRATVAQRGASARPEGDLAGEKKKPSLRTVKVLGWLELVANKFNPRPKQVREDKVTAWHPEKFK